MSSGTSWTVPGRGASAPSSIWGTFTLGDLIDSLKACPQDGDVRFDFCGAIPDGLDSYRGFYDHLAIGASGGNYGDTKTVTVAALLAELRDAVGKTYTGWKGGNFTMGLKTPLWVDNPGNCSSTAIVGVEVYLDSYVYLLTKWVPA